MAKTVQVLSNLNENLFDCEPSVRFDLAVKKFCGSSLAQAAGYLRCEKKKSYGLFLFILGVCYPAIIGIRIEPLQGSPAERQALGYQTPLE
jgi:hypothetical protein